MTRAGADGATAAPLGQDTELILVRHGVTAWNRERRFQGHTDPGLDDEGREQARRTASRLASEKVHALYASDLGRAWHTAAPLARALGLPARADSALRERRYGAFEGRSHDELMRDEPRAFERWEHRDADFELPGGGESLRAFNARVLAFVRALPRRHRGERVVAVTHGGVLDCVYRLATGMTLEAPRTHALLNASINRIGWRNGRFAVLGWGDVSHLSDALDDIEARA
ncbi:MAG: phosphoglycerate mutase family protein [Burkholderiaceae bacterium]|nr:phosphoglycerate mutase family protein [Burkholderiaceae bacterium]